MPTASLARIDGSSLKSLSTMVCTGIKGPAGLTGETCRPDDSCGSRPHLTHAGAGIHTDAMYVA